MEKHRCKQCYRRFASGRALAGHMRSHSVAAKASRRSRFLPSPSVSSSSLPPAKGCAGAGERGRRLSAELSSSRESDAESSLNRRPKRFRGVDVGDEPHSSVSDGSAEEDVARWLVMLSRDAWSRREAKGGPQSAGGGGDGGAEECEDGDGGGSRSPPRRLMEFQCEMSGAAACHSQKAPRGPKMGGMKHVSVPDEGFSGSGAASHGQEAKLWECPYCNRVFRSGQALGGHKRSHLSSSAIATTASLKIHLPSPHSAFPAATTAASNNNESRTRIDLNLPAPLEEEAELSALSVAIDLAIK